MVYKVYTAVHLHIFRTIYLLASFARVQDFVYSYLFFEKLSSQNMKSFDVAFICFYLRMVSVLAFRMPKIHKIIHNAYRYESGCRSTRLLMSTEVIDNKALFAIGDEITIAPATNVKTIVMKFGGSSLATAERIVYVSKLIKKHVEQGYRPTIVCSAMGKTTNSLLSAGDFALSGQIYVDSIRTMHVSTANTLGLPASTISSINDLINDLERLLEGVKYIGELSPRTKDTLVSFGERMSVKIVAATLNKLGVPAQSFESWILGMRTSSEFGNAEVLDETYGNVKSIMSKIDSMIVPVGKEC